ncbi:MAG: beta-ketoacyl-[acyl-carrier-protein] synthase family protein [Thermodesulfobacteriota bacterium]
MNSESESIVITGHGVVTSNGLDSEKFWANLLDGQGGYDQVTAFDISGQRTTIGCEANDFDEEAIVAAGLKTGGRATRMAAAATSEALSQAGLNREDLERMRVGVSLGTTMGEIRVLENYVENQTFSTGHADRSTLLNYPCSIIPKSLADYFNLRGPNLMIPAACAAGNYAIGAGRDLLLRDWAEVMIVGGVDPYSRVAHTGFNCLFSMSADVCRPFDRERRGIVLGEGAGILVLETESHARKRGADILAKVLGYGVSSDAFHITKPDPSGKGLVQAMERALRDSCLAPVDIDYISAHGTGTPANDAAETKAIKKLLGKRAYDVPVSSIKSMIGHAMGGASALEAVACIKSLRTGMIPPTMNYQQPDPECDLDYVPNRSRNHRSRVILSNSMAFGGNNCCLVLGLA